MYLCVMHRYMVNYYDIPIINYTVVILFVGMLSCNFADGGDVVSVLLFS